LTILRHMQHWTHNEYINKSHNAEKFSDEQHTNPTEKLGESRCSW